jgi:hypothetical protein
MENEVLTRHEIQLAELIIRETAGITDLEQATVFTICLWFVIKDVFGITAANKLLEATQRCIPTLNDTHITTPTQVVKDAVGRVDELSLGETNISVFKVTVMCLMKRVQRLCGEDAAENLATAYKTILKSLHYRSLHMNFTVDRMVWN